MEEKYLWAGRGKKEQKPTPQLPPFVERAHSALGEVSGKSSCVLTKILNIKDNESTASQQRHKKEGCLQGRNNEAGFRPFNIVTPRPRVWRVQGCNGELSDLTLLLICEGSRRVSPKGTEKWDQAPAFAGHSPYLALKDSVSRYRSLVFKAIWAFFCYLYLKSWYTICEFFLKNTFSKIYSRLLKDEIGRGKLGNKTNVDLKPFKVKKQNKLKSE